MTTTTKTTTGTVKTTTTGKSTKTGKLAKAMLAAAAFASVGVTMVPTEAEAGWRGRRNVAIGAGLFGALAVGGLLASGAYGHSGYGGYHAAPVYSGPDCYWTRQRRETWDGYVVIRKVRVCH
jgi:hypothetical protein